MSSSAPFSSLGVRNSKVVSRAIPNAPIRCRKCLTPIPPEAKSARFCVNCGYPVAQPCPYEDAHASWLSVRATDDLPVTECPNCRNILLACDTCGRLYTLTAQECRTPKCAGRLVEPGASFPSTTGPLDGSRHMDWPADFRQFQGDPVPLSTAPLLALACRYGRLVGASATALHVWSWQGDNWQQQEVRALPEPPLQGASLMMENGQVSVLLQSRTETYSLGELAVERTVSGAFTLQAMSRQWWVGVEKNQLHVVNVATGDARTEMLPPNLGGVADLRLVGPADSETIVLASEQSVLLLDPASGETCTPVLPETVRWVQTGVSSGRLFALGFKASRLTFCRLSLEGIEEEHVFESEMTGSFALSPTSAYFVNEGQGRVEVLDLDQLTRIPRSISLPGISEVGPDFQSLHSRDGRALLLLRLRTPSSSKFMLIDTQTGAKVAIPGAFGGTSMFCVAGARLIIAATDGGSAKLRTYQF